MKKAIIYIILILLMLGGLFDVYLRMNHQNTRDLIITKSWICQNDTIQIRKSPNSECKSLGEVEDNELSYCGLFESSSELNNLAVYIYMKNKPVSSNAVGFNVPIGYFCKNIKLPANLSSGDYELRVFYYRNIIDQKYFHINNN
jgi:hypothetical protein